MMRSHRIAAAAACALSLALLCPASAQVIGSGHVIGNGASFSAAPTDTPLIQVMDQPGSGLGAGVAAALGLNTNITGGLLTSPGLSANLPVIGGSSGGIAQGARSGNTATFATSNGTLTSGHCVSIDAFGNFIDAGGVCTVGGGGGTVAAGTANTLAYYASAGTTVTSFAAGTGVFSALGSPAGGAGGFALYSSLGTGAFAPAYTLPAATSSTLGGVKPDGTTITNSAGAISVAYGTAANTAAQGNDSRITGALQAANNLSDLASAATARTNLGLSALATASSVNLSSQATGTLQAAQMPSLTGDVTNPSGSLAATISSGAVTNAKLATAPTGTIKSNISGGTGSPSDNAISSVLDAQMGSTQGNVAYRGSSGWTSVPVGSGCVPIEAFGGKGDGSTDNTSALNNELAAFGAASGCGQFSAGAYIFNSQISYAYSGSPQSIMLRGSGQDVSVLKWPSTNGISLSLSSAQHTFHLRDLSFETGAANSYIGFQAINSVQGGALHQNDIQNVDFLGADGGLATDYWAAAVKLTGVANTIASGDVFTGGPGTAGTGILFQGNTAGSFKWGINLNLTNDIFVNLGNGLNLGVYWQGVEVTNCNFTNGNIAIYVPAGDTSNGLSQLAVTNTQFGPAAGTAVYLASPVGSVSFLGDLFIIPPNYAGIQGVTWAGGQIVGNQFVASGTVNDNQNGLIIGPLSASQPGPTTVTGNTFWNLTTGAYLQASSSKVNVQSNAYAGNTNTVVNSGTGNTVGGGSQ